MAAQTEAEKAVAAAEKQAAEDAAKQAAAEQERTELLAKLAAAEEREAKAAAKVAELEAEVSRAAMSAPAPLSASGTITVNHKGEVVTD